MKYFIVVTDDADNHAGTIIIQHPTHDYHIIGRMFVDQMYKLIKEIQQRELEEDDRART